MAYVRRHSRVAKRLPGDFVDLTKPRIVSLVLVTVGVGAWCGSWGGTSPWLVLHALLGTALVAASGSALNQLLERRADARMRRTADRPLPSGRLSSREVIAFASATIVAGLVYLAATTGLETTLLGLLTWVLYVWIYTPLKSRSVGNTVVGAVAGAMPILIGWSAVGGPWNLFAAALFFIVYLWQFPHFMAIAWIYRQQYAAAGLRMLPSVDPTGFRTGAHAVVAAAALLPVGMLPGVWQLTSQSLRALGARGWGLAVCCGRRRGFPSSPATTRECKEC